MFTKLVSIRTWEDEKQNPINITSIQNGELVGAGSLCPFFSSFFSITSFMTNFRVMVSVVCVNDLVLTLCVNVSVNVEYETCKCNYKYIYMIFTWGKGKIS
jgi:hypothetical protein